MYTLGIDIGSASSKAVLMEDGEKIRRHFVIQAGTGTSGPDKLLDLMFRDGPVSRDDIARTVVTGYGRYSLESADGQISEISCQAKGIHHLLPGARTVLDIGGQDVKAISIGPRGNVLSFYMNDKCAAGTGRFIDTMAKVMEIDVSQMGDYDEKSEDPVTVSSTCTVFAESEVISLLSQKKNKEDIIRGLHRSVVSRALGLMYRTSMEEDFVLTGGVALNKGVLRALKEELDRPVYITEEPQISAAVGAALFAWEQANKK